MDFIQSLCIAILYLIIKVIEDKLITKQNKPMKIFIRDTILVFISVLLGNFLIEQIKPLSGVIMNGPVVITSDPDF